MGGNYFVAIFREEKVADLGASFDAVQLSVLGGAPEADAAVGSATS